MIYADNAATTMLHPEALDAMMPFLTDFYGNPSQSYEFGKKSAKAIERARCTIAECIGADMDEIYFTSGGTEGDNWIIRMSSGPVYTSAIEHHAVLNACSYLNDRDVKYMPVDAKGTVLIPDELSKGGLISVMMANNETGVIQPVKKYASIAHENGLLFATDAVQAMGHIAIDVKEMGIDYLAASAHKFNGPRGIGFVYMKHGCELKPLIAGGAQERGKRAGTENVAAIVGMAKALRLNVNDIENRVIKLNGFTDIIKKRLSEAGIDYIVNTPENALPGLLSISFAGIKGETILHRLDIMGICISTGSACDSNNTVVSHVIKALEVPERYAKGTVRISLDMKNTLEDAEQIAAALIKVYGSFREKMGEII